MMCVRVIAFVCVVGSALGFSPLRNVAVKTTLSAASKSVPFLEQPAALDGTYAGDVGFDPVGFTAMWADKDWSQQIVPDLWPEAAERTPITTLQWMREAELKHGRFCMMATLGWVAVDCGLRYRIAKYLIVIVIVRIESVLCGSVFIVVVMAVLGRVRPNLQFRIICTLACAYCVCFCLGMCV
jgi:hypothetical protein